MKLNRRTLLRGSCQGAMAVMGLPFLDCFLNSKGQAQTNGRPLPTRFNTFFWGCGLTASLWIPKKAGTDWDMTVQLKPLEPYRKKLNVFSGLRVPLDSKPNGQHWSGLAAANTGIAPFRGGEFESKTIDQQVAEVIGKGVRFRSVSASSSGDPRQSYSSLGGSNLLPSEPTPLSLYTRLFGPGFQDPTKGDWKPDPRIMMQKSVLSAVAEDRHRVMQNLGASDRARMDQYFTSVRQTELQMEAELQRPTIEAKVSIPEAPSEDLVANNASPNLRVVTPLMARLGAIALATDQTRVFNLSVSSPQNAMFVPGDPLGFHQSTHEEPVDPKLGYQPRVARVQRRVHGAFRGVSEGTGCDSGRRRHPAGPQRGHGVHRPELRQDPFRRRFADPGCRRRQRPLEDRLSHRRRQQPGVACRLDVAKGVGRVGGHLGQGIAAGQVAVHGIAGVAR